MDTETTAVAGAGARFLRELIRTPKFREAVLLVLNSIDPPAARQVVRTFFWEDPVLFMSVLGAVPDIVNLFVNIVAEALSQAGALPDTLLRDFIDQIAAGLDGRALGEAAAGGSNLLVALGGGESASPMGGVLKLKAEFGEAYRADIGEEQLGQVRVMFEAAGEAIASNRELMDNLIRPLLGPAVSEIVRAQSVKPKDNEGG